MSHNARYAPRLSLWTDLQRLASCLEVKWTARLLKLPRFKPAETLGTFACSFPGVKEAGVEGRGCWFNPSSEAKEAGGEAAQPKLFLSFLFFAFLWQP